MSECWHYIRFGTISDGTISGMHCIYCREDPMMRYECDEPSAGACQRDANAPR